MLVYLTFLLQIGIIVSLRQQYLSIPYRTTRIGGTVEHLVQVEINRVPYKIDVTIQNDEDYIYNLAEMSAIREPVDRLDYSKNQNSVFGVIEFQGVERTDPRLEFKRRTAYNIYYYFRDFLPKIGWVNLKKLSQTQIQETVLSQAEGAFNFGPLHSNSGILRDLKKYSKYMRQTLVSFRGNLQDQDGVIILGEFPSTEVLNGQVNELNLQFRGQKGWTLMTMSLQLLKKGSNASNFTIYRQLIKSRLTFSSRLTIIPRYSKQTLLDALPSCNFDFHPAEKSQPILSCKASKLDIESFILQFSVKDGLVPLQLSLKDLFLQEKQGKSWFLLSLSENEYCQIGQSILRRYMIGINYKANKLFYGQLTEESHADRFAIIKILIILNLAIFLISLGIVLFYRPLRTSMTQEIDRALASQRKTEPNKNNSYQLAMTSEEGIPE